MPLFQRTDLLMGNRFDLGIVSENSMDANAGLAEAVEEIKRIERLLTTFDERSQTNQINVHAGIAPVEVDQEVFDLIARAQKIAHLTQGAFDLSYGSLDKRLWNFDQEMRSLPDPMEMANSVRLIDYQAIELDAANQTVFLRNKGMRIGFGGIGKGYAADRTKSLLVNLGFQHGVVNASGDMSAWGLNERGLPWQVAIVDPDDPQKAIAHFDLTNAAVATSGNYEKYVMIAGKKYSHTISPKTGYPIQGIKSVSVFAPVAELADALTTPIAVMGVEVGLDLVNQLNGINCVIIDDDNRIYQSKNIIASVT
ncbi:MAG: FAD:protein FMN transferase [Aquirufa sp.]